MDADNEPVLDSKGDVRVLRTCKCTEYGGHPDSDVLECVACKHHKSYHKQVQGSGLYGSSLQSPVPPLPADKHVFCPFSPAPTPTAPLVVDAGKAEDQGTVVSTPTSIPSSGHASASGSHSSTAFGPKVYFTEWSTALPGNLFFLTLFIT